MAYQCSNAGFSVGHIQCGVCHRHHCERCGFSIDDGGECWTGDATYPRCTGNEERANARQPERAAVDNPKRMDQFDG